MNKAQIKYKMALLKTIDWVLLLLVIGIGVPGMFLTDYPVFIGLATLAGLVVVHVFGNWVGHRIAAMRVDLKNIDRKI